MHQHPMTSFYTIVPCQWPPLGAPTSVPARFDAPSAAHHHAQRHGGRTAPPGTAKRNATTQGVQQSRETPCRNRHNPGSGTQQASDGNKSGGHKGCVGRTTLTGTATGCCPGQTKRCVKACEVATEHLHSCEQNLKQAQQARSAVQEAEEEVSRVKTLVVPEPRVEPPRHDCFAPMLRVWQRPQRRSSLV